MGALLAAVALVAAIAFLSAALAKGQIFFEDTVPPGKTAYVRFKTFRPAAFRILLRVPTAGQAQLFLLGRYAPKGGPLITTSPATQSSACQGATQFFICSASYEPLPNGTYVWRLRWVGPRPAHVELTVRW